MTASLNNTQRGYVHIIVFYVASRHCVENEDFNLDSRFLFPRQSSWICGRKHEFITDFTQ